MSAVITIAALLLTPPGTPAGGFHWQRIITPPSGAGTQQACVVLDAATFANAAPALRDLRLFQDGTELPYVIEESFDERALNSGVTPDDDRSEYEVVSVIPLSRLDDAGPALGDSAVQVAGYQGTSRILAHVPVERLRLEPEPTLPTPLRLTAAVPSSGAQGTRAAASAEVVQTLLAPGQSTWAVTMGANLQHAADIRVDVPATFQPLRRVTLEMRKRSLCYQPRSASSLVLYLGGGQGISAKVYGLASSFSTDRERPYGTMGPLEPNPDLDRPTHHPTSRLLIAIAILGATLLLTLWIGLELLRKEKGRPQAAHS